MNTNLVFFAAALAAVAMLFSRSASAAGVQLLRQFEAFSPSVYYDESGRPHIGYGHLIKAGESFPRPISHAEGEALLKIDLQPVQDALKRLVKVSLNQNQIDALSSFIFNVGVQAFADSTLLKKLNTGDYAGAANEFPRWNKVTVDGVKQVSDGLTYRRAIEQQVFLS